MPFAVEISREELEAIFSRVEQGVLRRPYGGLEVGGVLFGVYENDRLCIVATRKFETDYSSGPQFEFSQRNEQRLVQLLEESKSDPALKGLQPLGWYQSRLHGNRVLSDRAAEVFAQHFPEHWQIVMLVRPVRRQRPLIEFLVRHRAGETTTEPLPERPSQVPGLPEGVRRIEMQYSGPSAPAVPVLPQEQVLGSGRGWGIRLLALATLLAGLGIAYWVLLPALKAVPTAASLELRLATQGDGTLVQWDARSEAVRQAGAAWLEIAEDDQPASVMPLNSFLLAEGRFLHSGEAGVIRVRLRIQPERGDPIEGHAIHVPGDRRRPAAQAKPDHAALLAEMEDARLKLEAERQENLRMEAQVVRLTSELRQRLSTRNPRAAKPPAPAPPKSEPPKAAAEPVPQLVQQVPAALAELSQSPTLSTAASGKLIWIGAWPEDGLLTIENGRPSSGRVLGALPGGPIRIRVSAGEMTGRGLTVFSADSRYSGSPVSEAPSQQNRFNRTEYVYRPDIASRVRVEEAPGAGNGWNRLQLRCPDRSVPAVVVDWEKVP